MTSQPRRDQKRNSPTEALAAGSRSVSCSSKKWAWPTRRGAKAAALNLRRRERGATRPYRCVECGAWHVGHIPRAVARGEMSVEEWYGREAAQ